MLKLLAKLLAGFAAFVAIVLYGWYQIDGIPSDQTKQYLSGEDYAVSTEADGGLIFMPNASNGSGIVIMHGALIKPQSYARSAAFFAQRGYTVYLPNGPGRMSIAVGATAAKRMQAISAGKWFFIGHSMGGMASLDLIQSQGVHAEAVALWATAMPKDFSKLRIPILFIWGDNDGLLPLPRFQAAQANLPQATRYITLAGANHKNFALYTHQFFDSDATIDWIEQIDFANQTTADFFGEFND
jgi:pimeloyl-ACP methyl ester carboxylesterase